jgi:capsid protein
MAVGDTAESNYSSARMEHLAWHRQLRVLRSDFIEFILDKILRAWIEEARLIPGYLPAGLTYDNLPHRWFFDSAASIDPVKDATAEDIRLKNGSESMDAIMAERGEDWEELYERRARVYAKAKKLADQNGVPLEEMFPEFARKSAPNGKPLAAQYRQRKPQPKRLNRQRQTASRV